MDENSSLIPLESSNNVNDNKTNYQGNSTNISIFSLLYYQIFGIIINPSIIILDKNESYKRLDHDRIIKTVIYLSDLFTNKCLPYRLSPTIIPLPGLVLNVTLFMLIYTSSQLYRYYYILWLIVQYGIYIIDGKQARRNATQSLARHYWDHWCEVLNLAIADLIIIKLYPVHLNID
ncbi:unnamed protein product [Didymodactylos carnosus]|uniref:Uncharacterized protein n=1 Tax=Didymodactylos carnosus TaxID=1234261 RepID=A0A815VUQ6_9BILA|nr:unnamed protein product [Didymodactylos carnosus]CAF1532723.1 unnamed protein product [Didymodactylos carnosus]CAF3975662.1 unnamed protein product [Didymodactylos carnosus]CAF4392141.1 unnamed protein product [Didymodactylos carnosus]